MVNNASMVERMNPTYRWIVNCVNKINIDLGY